MNSDPGDIAVWVMPTVPSISLAPGVDRTLELHLIFEDIISYAHLSYAGHASGRKRPRLVIDCLRVLPEYLQTVLPRSVPETHLHEISFNAPQVSTNAATVD